MPAASPSFDLPVDWPLIDAVEGRFGFAVSGGSDSLAMAVLLSAAMPADRAMILTVDHGLRAGAALDAAFVEDFANRLGLPFAMRRLSGTPQGSLQAWARTERYRALADMAAAHDLAAVAVAHTEDDLAETLLMRLRRASGLRGLAAMAPAIHHGPLLVLRPMLRCSRAALREELTARGMRWREDPSNADPQFERVRARTAVQQLEEAGIDRSSLAASAVHLARANAFVEAALDAAWNQLAAIGPSGEVSLKRNGLAALPPEIRLRVLGRATRIAGGAENEPRFATLTALSAAVSAGETGHAGGALAIHNRNRLLFVRENRNINPLALRPHVPAVFDRRFEVVSEKSGLTVNALGPWARAVPQTQHRRVIETAPAFFAGERPVAAPTLGVWQRDFPRGAVMIRRLIV